MSLRINHNLAALNAHRNLVNTNSALQQSMQKLSSGFRINQGADNPAGLVISEQFRAQIAGLNRAIDNSEGSISMVQTAEGALNEINNLLISMRELAIHAANEGFNDADQLAADQAEIENAIATIDRIAANTQFGTKKLLDGSKANVATITSSNNSALTIRQSNLTSGTHSVTATKTADSTATLNTTALGVTLANTNGNPVNLTEDIHDLDIVQASDVAKKTSSAVQIADAFGNNLTIAAAADAASLATAAAFAAATAGNVGTYTFTVQHSDVNEGTTSAQTISVDVALGDDAAAVAAKINTEIGLNSVLTGKIGASAAAGVVTLTAANQGAQYSIRTTASSTDATDALFSIAAGSDRGVSDNQLTVTATTEANSTVAQTITLTAGTYASLSALVTELDTQLATAFGLAAGGAAGEHDVDAVVTDTNKIQIQTKDEGSAYSIQMGTLGAASGNLEHILGLTEDSIANAGTDALISFDNYTQSVDRVKFGSTYDMTIANAATGETNRGTLNVTISRATIGLNVGSALLDVKAAKFDVRLDGGPATSVTAGVNTTVYNADRSESLVLYYALTAAGGTETINNVDRSLVFQIGANVGQTAKIGLRNMAASALGKGTMSSLFGSLADIDVTTVQGAQDAQTIIDAAINEVSTTRGTLGSFQKNTLESNLRNLRIAAENLTASESMIRDTDMAKEMSEFTKNQILVQAGTAMLAQANQTPQIVLSLFQ